MATREHMVELDAATYRALEADARRRRMVPDALAQELVRERLAQRSDTTAEQVKAAVAGLAAVLAQVKGPVDAVALVR